MIFRKLWIFMKRYKIKLITIFTIMCLLNLRANIRWYIYNEIPKISSPYFYNKDNIVGVYIANVDLFEAVVKYSNEFGENNPFHYNSNLGDEQVYNRFGNGEVANVIIDIVKHCNLTDFYKLGDYLYIYQYLPITYCELKIGMKYDLKYSKWYYYYYHDYADCHHKHRKLYRIYDLLYNQPGMIE